LVRFFPSIWVSLLFYCGCPTVGHKSETPSIQQLGGFTCYFLGVPSKYPVEHTYRLSVGSGDAPACSYICPTSKA
jgi:hypothetical protein